MRRMAVLCGAVLLVAGGSAGVMRYLTPRERVYAPEDIAAQVRAHPRTWIGRTVLIRGTLISIAYTYTGSQGSRGSGRGGCDFPDSRCVALIGATLRALPEGSTVHVALAGYPHSFTFRGNGGAIVLQHPAGALTVRCALPCGGSDPVPVLLRRWALLAPLLPAVPRGLPTTGVYRLRLVSVPARRQPWQDDAVLLDVR